ncbi:MAG: hypothetical protein QNK89_02025 [Lacinutrix sp.]|uniref:hypothetical protein n=1 Tax=Lacinutrix sp. TaxID=1937692 RepID=UPI00309C8EC6
MYREVFDTIAKNENGKFNFKDKDISIGGGVRSPNVTYKLAFKYKENKFTIINRTGTAYVGTITCELSKTIQPIYF